MTNSKVQRQTSAGELIVAWDDCGVWLRATLNGREIHAALGYGTLPSPRTINGTTIKHYVGNGATACTLYPEEIAMLDAAKVTLVAAYNITPAGLAEARSQLCREISYATDADQDRRERDWSRGEEMAWASRDTSGKVAAARRALADFDAAHPEIAALAKTPRVTVDPYTL